MKASNHFKIDIQTYLNARAQEDPLFASSYAKTDKNIDDCISYILHTVEESGCNGFADYEIYSMATYYYEKDNIDIGKPSDCHVVVNHVVELTEEEKEQARQEAIRRVQSEAYAKMKQPKKTHTKPVVTDNVLTLF